MFVLVYILHDICIYTSNARSALKNESISINENFAAEVEYRRRLLYPILKAAKQSSRFEGKAFINGDTLVLNNQSYSVEDLHKLPRDLHPSNLSKKENDQWLIFSSILSQYNCLSNFYKSKLIHDDTEFDTIEAAYQYTKATRFYDKACANNVILVQSPSKAKSPGSNVNGFKKSVWDSEKEYVMLDLLRAKFSPNSPLAAELKGCCCLPTPMALASGGSPMFPLVVHQPASPSIWPAVQSLRRGLSTNPGATMWCVCGCS